MEAALLGLVGLFLLLACGVPVGIAMTVVGVVGFASIVGVGPASALAGQIVYDNTTNFSFSVLPMFILMGTLIARSRLSHDLFEAAAAFLGHRRGGLAYATVTASGGFSAVCGSSAATTATMVRVAYPAMRERNYGNEIATGAVAVGGTLGILIPPSTIMILYGVLTETNIVSLFAAGFIPGAIAVLCHFLAIWVMGRLYPDAAPKAPRVRWEHRWRTVANVWGIVVLFLVMMGGIYFGIFTPTEGGAVGVAGALLFAIFKGGLTFKEFVTIAQEACRTTAMIFIILFGAIYLSAFLEVSGFTSALASFVVSLDLGATGTMLLIFAIYLLLGCFIESISMMFLTVPLFFPIAVALGFDPVWFGILVIVAIEISLITPPIGLNVFIMRGLIPEVPLRTMFVGVTPFVASSVVLLLLLTLFPKLVTVLPDLMR
ncbi:TRAP transporter large permease [Amorphus sp. 3PC139-8]|uniref:TRAP transporter large permease n=1 Tax=Amorphus sp. 3PC139-8 TaxID=2735676 RepID=UPI00345D5CAC